MPLEACVCRLGRRQLLVNNLYQGRNLLWHISILLQVQELAKKCSKGGTSWLVGILDRGGPDAGWRYNELAAGLAAAYPGVAAALELGMVAVRGRRAKLGILADAAAAELERLEGMGQMLGRWKRLGIMSGAHVKNQRAGLRELNQPLKLACTWKLGEVCAMNLNAHGLCIRLAHPQILARANAKTSRQLLCLGLSAMRGTHNS